MKKLSIVVPVYYNEDNLLPLYADLKEKVLPHLPDYEIVFVDDGSKDRSYQVMQQLAKLDAKVKLVRLSRNFGEYPAILAGLSVCTGDCAIRKAADLQDPSELILPMLEKMDEGNDIVLAVRTDRDEPLSQKMFANTYYWLLRKFALKNMPSQGFDCFMLSRKVIDVLLTMKETTTPLPERMLWTGFQTGHVQYVRQKREIGKSKWTLAKKLNLVFDGLFGFSRVPVRVITTIGFASIVGAVAMTVWALIDHFRGTTGVEGYTSMLILMLFGFGVIIFFLGILGEYLLRIHDESKRRPQFIIERQEDGSNLKE